MLEPVNEKQLQWHNGETPLSFQRSIVLLHSQEFPAVVDPPTSSTAINPRLSFDTPIGDERYLFFLDVFRSSQAVANLPSA